MLKETIAIGKDVVEAKENARLALGCSELDDVQFEILHMGSKGILGIIGVKPAKVKAFIELPDAQPKRQRHEKKEAPKAENANNTHTVKNEQAKPKNKSNNKHKNNKPKAEAEKAEAKVKSQVVPEVTLKMEEKSVEKGEDMSFDFINTVIADIGLNATATLYSCEDGTRRITIKGEDASTLIGHHGDTLDALQYLANLACARKNIHGERDKSRVTLDIEGYRAKREDTLRALARRMAAKALKNKRSVMLEPMSAYERRIIHSEIQNIEGVSTNSVGSDNNRKIVIYLTDKKPQGIFEEETFEVDETTNNVVQNVDVSSDCEEATENDTVVVEMTHPDSCDELVPTDEDLK